MVSQTEFREQVRTALLHLYDYERLDALPLGRWLRAQPGRSGQSTLHQVLLDAVEGLRPGPGTPPSAPRWRAYHILFYRFVQGMTVAEVAQQMGFGERHFRRLQARAIRLLADTLWERCDRSRLAEAPADPGRQADLGANLAWLQSDGAPQQANLAEVVRGVQGVVARRVVALGTRVELSLPEGLPLLSIHPLAMRQVLVSALSYALGRVPGGRIEVAAEAAGGVVRLRGMLWPGPGEPPRPTASEDLEVARQLLGMYGGRLDLCPAEGGALAIEVRVPAALRPTVLIVDDNPDTATLFARYLAESRYHPVVAHSGSQAATLAQEIAPSAIVLDVMMPAQDGWEVLGLLKAHPATEAIPVIVATILTDRDLALSLGAAAFLHKPVSQAELLQTLDRLVG